ncbi:hypothetical protein CTI12_AA484620 [Artemisia annua]|uniref:valine--tRNA ligase n=1 Tax=Artemisia annua TaxID=35608 RepID=A0A2U1LK50_ARTAN|nr:hypothetical protein CTI12_AA484620 [Artemisia annua]
MEEVMNSNIRLPFHVINIGVYQGNCGGATACQLGLFPLTGLGWHDETQDFKSYYPNSVLVTRHDILFLWCARIVMLGMKLGGDVPFTKVYLHPMSRDKSGRKMSKSLGNVIDLIGVIQEITLEDLQEKLKNSDLDPAEFDIAKEAKIDYFPNGIQQCGIHALQFSLVSYTSQAVVLVVRGCNMSSDTRVMGPNQFFLYGD